LYLRRQAQTLRVLEGMLPICSFCKRIRSGESWEPLERFIGSHSEATFSHTFCPECGSRFYGDLVD
jgi:two-component system cell cycle response regulator